MLKGLCEQDFCININQVWRGADGVLGKSRGSSQMSIDKRGTRGKCRCCWDPSGPPDSVLHWSLGKADGLIAVQTCKDAGFCWRMSFWEWHGNPGSALQTRAWCCGWDDAQKWSWVALTPAHKPEAGWPVSKEKKKEHSSWLMGTPLENPGSPALALASHLSRKVEASGPWRLVNGRVTTISNPPPCAILPVPWPIFYNLFLALPGGSQVMVGRLSLQTSPFCQHERESSKAPTCSPMEDGA